MNTTEKMLYLSSQLMMLSLDKEHNQKEIEKVSEELAALQRQLREKASAAPPDEENSGFLEFTEKEILKMPKTFRKEFRTQGCTARVLMFVKHFSENFLTFLKISFARCFSGSKKPRSGLNRVDFCHFCLFRLLFYRFQDSKKGLSFLKEPVSLGIFYFSMPLSA